MRTEQDLFTTLAQREDLAPDPDPVLAGAQLAATSYRRRRRRMAAGAIAAAAIAIAAVVTLPGMLGDGSSGPPGQRVEGTGPRPPLAFTIQPTTVAGFEVHPYGVAAGYQLARILAVGDDEPLALLIVYEPHVAGQVTGDDGEVLLRWEYAPDGFAEIHGEAGPPLDGTTLRELADGLRFTEPYSARLPYRLDYLPPGVVPYEVGQYTARAGLFGSVVALEDFTNPTAPSHIDIAVGVAFDLDDDRSDPEPDTTIAGRPAACDEVPDGRHCSVTFGVLTVEVSIANVSDDDLARIVGGIQLVPTWDEDPTVWYELDDALPGE